MKHNLFFDQLNDYLDSELDAPRRLALERHLDGCVTCRDTLEGLREVRGLALGLDSPTPPEAVWTKIRDARGSSSPARSRRDHLYGALALAATVVLAVGIWVASPPAEPPRPGTQEMVQMVTEELRAAESHYANAIGGLEQVIRANDGVLTPEIAAVLNDNLDLIESAIDESRAALQTEPESNVAQESLLEALRRKVSLLQNTILLINEVRKGQGENAMDLIDEIRETAPPSNPI